MLNIRSFDQVDRPKSPLAPPKVLRSVDFWLRKCVKSCALLLRRRARAVSPSPSGASLHFFTHKFTPLSMCEIPQPGIQRSIEEREELAVLSLSLSLSISPSLSLSLSLFIPPFFSLSLSLSLSLDPRMMEEKFSCWESQSIHSLSAKSDSLLSFFLRSFQINSESRSRTSTISLLNEFCILPSRVG